VHRTKLRPGIDPTSLNGLADELEDEASLAQLAALAIEHQGELHSNDADFGRFPQLRWVNPLD
jgi:predicted nucleic acid-binding protein